MLSAINLFNQGKKAEALKIFEYLIHKSTFDKDLFFNYAFVLGNMGFYLKEQNIYELILRTYPNDVEALVNLAISSNETKIYDKAVQASSRAITLRQDIPEAYEARGIALLAINKISEGLEDLKIWIELLLKDCDAKTKEIFKSCIDLMAIPAIYESSEEVLECRHNLERNIALTQENLKNIRIEDLNIQNIGVKIAFKLNHFYLAYQQKNDKDLNQQMCEIISLLLNNKNEEKLTSNKAKAKKKLGVISTFKYHPKLFIFDQLSNIDMDKFEVHVYVFNNSNFNTEIVNPSFTIHSVEFNPDTYKEVVKFLKEERCDYIFMPDIGMSIESRVLSVHNFAQTSFMNWLHPVTSGSPNISYFFSGQLMESGDSDTNYVEKLISFPGVGLKINPKDYISITAEEIQNKSINDDEFKVGCLQTPFKYHPDHDQLILDIAATIKAANFYFIKYQDGLDHYLMNRLKRLFVKNSLNPERVRLIDRMDKNNYQKFLKTLDISLDSIGWSGGNTTLDAFGVGLPVLTIPQSSMRSRHTSAIYEMMNMKELVCSCYEDLIRRIDDFNKNPESLINTRKSLLLNFSQLKTECYLSKFINELN